MLHAFNLFFNLIMGRGWKVPSFPSKVVSGQDKDVSGGHFIAFSRAQRKDGAVSYGIAAVDFSTGVLRVFGENAPEIIHNLLLSIPGDVVVPDRIRVDDDISAVIDSVSNRLVSFGGRGDAFSGERLLCEHYGVPALSDLGDWSRPDVAAMGLAVTYLVDLGSRAKLRLPCRGSF